MNIWVNTLKHLQQQEQSTTCLSLVKFLQNPKRFSRRSTIFLHQLSHQFVQKCNKFLSFFLEKKENIYKSISSVPCCAIPETYPLSFPETAFSSFKIVTIDCILKIMNVHVFSTQFQHLFLRGVSLQLVPSFWTLWTPPLLLVLFQKPLRLQLLHQSLKSLDVI